MKKSFGIKLVLIGAALSSCNRIILPSQSSVGEVPDSSLVSQPPIDRDLYDNSFNFCCNAIPSIWAYSFNSSPYPLYIPQGAYSAPVRSYRRGHFWRNHHFIIRGGWGESGETANS